MGLSIVRWVVEVHGGHVTVESTVGAGSTFTIALPLSNRSLTTHMGNDLERLNQLLDDLAAERDPAARAALSAAEVELAETAAFLKAADAARIIPDEAFVRCLGARLAAARQNEDPPGSRPPARAIEAPGVLGTADYPSTTPSPVRHSTAQRDA